jgi:hypothetical protein
MIVILSLIGFVLCFGAYLMNQYKWWTVDSWQFNYATLIGCACLLVNSLIVRSVGLSLMQIAYGGIALQKIRTLQLIPFEGVIIETQ